MLKYNKKRKPRIQKNQKKKAPILMQAFYKSKQKWEENLEEVREGKCVAATSAASFLKNDG